jgi:hypothetical protein
VSEEQSNDTLRYLQGLFNVDKYKSELMLRNKANKEAAENIPHQEMLRSILPKINEVLNHSGYNKVDLSKIFGFMTMASKV